MKGALAGIKVLDLSRLLPGPFCSMLLADMGADVIKIEDPRGGDYIRSWPPLLGTDSGFHAVLNRNKRSLTLNLKKAEGKAILTSLVRGADVVLEGFRPGVMDRLGVGYPALREINPKLVYCAITGYGAQGERALRAGHDINYLALNGILSFSGRDGVPTIPGVQIADLGGGALYAAFGIVTALLARERIGEGQFIDIAMADGALTWSCLRWGKYLADRATPAPGDDFLNHGFACYNLYRTKDDRYMALGAIEPQFWKAFCQATEHPEWNRSDYFEPGAHQAELAAAIGAWFLQRTQAEWIDHFADWDCCCEPVLNLTEVLDDPEMLARGMVIELSHEDWGSYRQLGIAPKLSLTPGQIRSHAPGLGEHTLEILDSLGYDRDQAASLKQQGVI